MVGDWTSNRRIDRAARELNGQMLLGVTTNSRGARTRFLFDLGAELVTKPYDRRSEQWFLFEPTGRVLTFRADGMYQYAPGDRSPEESPWRKLQRANSDGSRRR